MRLEFTVMNWTTGRNVGHWYSSLAAALEAVSERCSPGDCYTIWEALPTADHRGCRSPVLDGRCPTR
jgi:hypothetical protein